MVTLYNEITNQAKVNRQYRLIVQNVDENDNPIEEATVITNPITIKFSVNRTLFADVNSMDIELYNLKPDTYNRLFFDYFNVKRRTIILEAGYEGQVLSTIFIGDVWTCYTSRQGCDIITKIHAIVGLKSLQARTNVTLRDISRDEVIRTAAKDMGMPVEIYSGENTKFSRPVVLEGNSMGIIQKYSGGNAFIDENKIKILMDRDAIDTGLILITDKSGLLGVPEHEDALLTVNMIFEPRIVIGQLIEIQSRIMSAFDGQYKVYGLKHEGIISNAIAGQCTTKLEMLVGSQVYGRFHAKTKQ